MVNKKFAFFYSILSSCKITCIVLSFLVLANIEYSADKGDGNGGDLFVGWAKVDVTPSEPVIIRSSTISEGVQDPITATVLAIESRNDATSENVIMIIQSQMAYGDHQKLYYDEACQKSTGTL